MERKIESEAEDKYDVNHEDFKEIINPLQELRKKLEETFSYKDGALEIVAAQEKIKAYEQVQNRRNRELFSGLFQGLEKSHPAMTSAFSEGNTGEALALMENTSFTEKEQERILHNLNELENRINKEDFKNSLKQMQTQGKEGSLEGKNLINMLEDLKYMQKLQVAQDTLLCRGWQYNKKFAEEHPEFQPYYDTEKNERPFNSYSNMSNEYAWWKCDKGHTFEWSIINFSQLGRFECPICTNKMFVAGKNDLESQYPDLATEFDIEKNGITPDKVAFTYTNDEIWWKCAEGHEFQRSVWYRVNQVRGCPICNRSIVVKGINDFQTAFPDVVKIWDYEKNEKGPDTISDRTNKKFSFKCKQNHHYETQLKTAAFNNFECMICSGKIIQEGVNSLVDTSPDLAKEFSQNEERRPSEFTKKNVYSIKWQCPTCSGE
ncbi:MAG: zinc-ribbon domain-containing protein [Thermotaleaceae bacterium]